MEAILIVLPDPGRLPQLLAAMQRAGAPGATVFDSQGLQFLSWLGHHPAMARHWNVEGQDPITSKSVIAIVPEGIADAVVTAVEDVLGGFSTPNSGMLCTWHVAQFRCFQGDKPRAAVAGGRP